MVIEGVDRYRVVEPMFECARVVMHHRGETYSTAYVHGIAGTAFTIGGICPCAPTCVKVPLGTADLLRKFGYGVAAVKHQAKAPDAEQQYAAFLGQLREDVAAGRPVIVWHAFTNYEWDVVCGYDDRAGEGRLLGYGSYAGGDQLATSPADRPRGGMDVTDTIALMVREKTGRLDARAAEIAAMRFAIEHAHCQKNADKADWPEWAFFEGIRCYERWARDFASPAKKRGVGDSYCLGVVSSTRRCAAGFAKELAGKYPAAAMHLLAAMASFTQEADALDALKPLLGWESPEGPDAGRNAKAATLIAQAGEHYKQAIGGIECALGLMQ